MGESESYLRDFLVIGFGLYITVQMLYESGTVPFNRKPSYSKTSQTIRQIVKESPQSVMPQRNQESDMVQIINLEN